MSQQPEMTLAQLGAAVWRRKVTAVAVFLGILSLGVMFWLLWPREFASEGRLFVQIGRANTGLDPTSSPKSVAIQDARETEIRSVMELIKSPGLLQAVVDRVGAEAILDNSLRRYLPAWEPAAWLAWLAPASAPAEESPEELARLKRRELAVKHVSNRLDVTLEKNSSVICLYVRAYDSRLAQELIDALMDETMRRHLAVHSKQTSGEVFQAELDRHRELVRDALEEQAQFRNARGILSLEASRNTLQMQLDKLELELLDVEVNLAQARRRAAELRDRLDGLDEFVDAPNRGLESISTEGARGELFRLESERARLTALYHERHPLVAQVTEQIASLRGELDKLPPQRTELLAVVNPVFAEVKVALIDQESVVAGLEARRADLLDKRRELTDRLVAFNQDEALADHLAQQVDIRRRHLDVYIQKAGEAQVLAELDRQRVSDVVVAQPALRMYKAVSPRGSIVLPIAAALGALAGILAAWWRDTRSNRWRRAREEIQEMLNVPVLATLPRVAARRQMVR